MGSVTRIQDGEGPAPARGEGPAPARGEGPAPARARTATATAPSRPAAGRSYARLGRPRPVRVRADASGRPETVSGREVEAVRESWLVEDRWWTDAPLRRRYWEVVTADGRDLVVFRDLQEGRWYGQRS